MLCFPGLLSVSVLCFLDCMDDPGKARVHVGDPREVKEDGRVLEASQLMLSEHACASCLSGLFMTRVHLTSVPPTV